jgi:replication fork protection complex subunit Tof1/Swi1
VDFDDDEDDEGAVSAEDHGEYGADAPTARKPDGERKKPKRRQRVRTPVELDDEEKDRRAAARRKKELEKLVKEKSTIFVHDSDDEDDAERDAAFFAREEALRQEMKKALGKSLVLGSVEPATSKKRKAEIPASESKRRKTPPKRKAFADSDDDSDEDMGDAPSVSSRAPSIQAQEVLEVESADETTDTPLSSQHAAGAHEADGDTPMKTISSSTAKSRSAALARDSNDEDDEDVPVVRRQTGRKPRAIFDDDSE